MPCQQRQSSRVAAKRQRHLDDASNLMESPVQPVKQAKEEAVIFSPADAPNPMESPMQPVSETEAATSSHSDAPKPMESPVRQAEVDAVTSSTSDAPKPMESSVQPVKQEEVKIVTFSPSDAPKPIESPVQPLRQPKEEAVTFSTGAPKPIKFPLQPVRQVEAVTSLPSDAPKPIESPVQPVRQAEAEIVTFSPSDTPKPMESPLQPVRQAETEAVTSSPSESDAPKSMESPVRQAVVEAVTFSPLDAPKPMESPVQPVRAAARKKKKTGAEASRAGRKNMKANCPNQLADTVPRRQVCKKKRRKTIGEERIAYDAAFKLSAVQMAVKHGNRKTASKLGINESMVRRWRSQKDDLEKCTKTTKAFRGAKAKWPELEAELKDWVHSQRLDARGLSSVQVQLKAKAIAAEKKIEGFNGGPSWCFRFMRRAGQKNNPLPAAST